MSETSEDTRQPVLYLSHGAPPLADDPVWTRQLADWSRGFAKPANNLRWFNPAAGPDGQPPKASEEFDSWAAEALERQDVDAILDFMHKAPAAHEAHPRTEHWAPLYVSLGAAYESGSLDNDSVIE